MGLFLCLWIYNIRDDRENLDKKILKRVRLLLIFAETVDYKRKLKAIVTILLFLSVCSWPSGVQTPFSRINLSGCQFFQNRLMLDVFGIWVANLFLYDILFWIWNFLLKYDLDIQKTVAFQRLTFQWQFLIVGLLSRQAVLGQDSWWRIGRSPFGYHRFL